MEIIPAIDLRERRCVRLLRGQYEQERVYSDDPVEIARQWEAQGASRLHVVDLDGARLGVPQNLEVAGAIVKNVKMPVQFGGGVRNESTIEKVLAMGVDRIIIGTAAVADNVFTRRALEKYGDQVIISIDANEGRVATRGWTEVTETQAVAFAQELEKLGAQRFIFTDISRDGTLSGPNLERLREVARAVYVPIIASGGISVLDDIRAVKGVEPDGVEGVIIGTALYECRVTLADCLAVAAAVAQPVSAAEQRRRTAEGLLELAQESFGSARFCLDRERYRAAADLAGSSIVTAARALIILHGDVPPQTASGVMARFVEIYVQTDELGVGMDSELDRALQVRLSASTDPNVIVGKDEVGVVLDMARRVLDELRKRAYSRG